MLTKQSLSHEFWGLLGYDEPILQETEHPMRATTTNLSPTPRRLGFFNIIGLYTYGPGCLSRTLVCVFFLIAVAFGLREYLVEKTAFRNARVVKGTVTGSGYTNWSFNETEQLEVSFSYPWAGKQYQGFSYTTRGGWTNGSEVDVEVNPDNPNHARIAGLDYAQFHFFVYGPLILAILLLISAVLGTLKAYRWGRLLENGLVAEGEVEVVDEVKQGKSDSDKVNAFTKMRISFTDAEGNTHQVNTQLTGKMRGDDKKILFYDRKRPTRILLLQQIPLKLKLERQGKWAPPESKVAVTGWFLFAAGFLVWALYIVFNWK
jgi:hypothetical protein